MHQDFSRTTFRIIEPVPRKVLTTPLGFSAKHRTTALHAEGTFLHGLLAWKYDFKWRIGKLGAFSFGVVQVILGAFPPH